MRNIFFVLIVKEIQGLFKKKKNTYPEQKRSLLEACGRKLSSVSDVHILVFKDTIYR